LAGYTEPKVAEVVVAAAVAILENNILVWFIVPAALKRSETGIELSCLPKQ